MHGTGHGFSRGRIGDSLDSVRAQESVRIGSSSIGSTFYIIAVAASELVQKHAGISTSAESVGGSTASINAIGAGKIEFALSNAFAAAAIRRDGLVITSCGVLAAASTTCSVFSPIHGCPSPTTWRNGMGG